MPEPLAALLEPGQAARGGGRRVVPGTGRILQSLGVGQHGPHLFRVIRPVRGQMQGTADFELAPRERREIRLHQAALVMPLLRPGIGERKNDFEIGSN